MNKKGVTIVVIIIVIIIIAIIGFTSYSSPSETATTTDQGTYAPLPDTTGTDTGTTTTDVSTSTTAGQEVKSFTVNGSNFSFSPSTMTVNKGDKVVINFVNSGGTHDFKIDEFGVATPLLQGGQSATVTFTADKSGTFQYYCSVLNHRAMGMVGTLTIK